MHSTFSQEDWVALVVFAVAVYLPVVDAGTIRDTYNAIITASPKSSWLRTLMLSPWMYGIIWAFLYAIMVTGILMFWILGRVTHSNFIVVMVMFISTLAFFKIYSALMFAFRAYGAAVWAAFASWLTLGVGAGFAAAEAYQHEVKIWTTFAFFATTWVFLTYGVLLTYLIYINFNPGSFIPIPVKVSKEAPYMTLNKPIARN